MTQDTDNLCPICSKEIKKDDVCQNCLPSTRVKKIRDGAFSVGYQIKYSDTPIGRALKKHGPKYDYGVLLTKPLKYEEEK
mgnify:CR=1 FL=1